MPAFEFPLAIIFSAGRADIDTTVVASNLQTAIFVALDEAKMEDGDVVQVIECGKPIPWKGT